MNCRQARQNLNKYNWSNDLIGHNSELLSHLDSCPDCRALLKAEKAITSNLDILRRCPSENDITVESLRETIATAESSHGRRRNQTVIKVPSTGFRPGLVKWYAIAGLVVLVAIAAFVPFNFKERVGYEITIAGVDKDIVADNQDITPLLEALGMEAGMATNLLDSLGTDRARLHVGECRETCHLRISDLKSERNVRLVVKAIIELGCCQIEKIAPIFRDESSSLLKYAAKKLYS
jgi:hypothetical protein